LQFIFTGEEILQSLEDRVAKAKEDKDEANRLIFEFKPFIASVVQKKAGRFVEYGIDEELSVGLMAFKEAIDSYDREKSKFLSFAKLVISMRLIDYYRKTKKEKSLNTEGSSPGDDDMDAVSMEQYKIDDENEKRILEIIEYRSMLGKWGISLEQLADVSPKKEDLREQYKMAARVIAGNEGILNIFLNTKRLPIKEIENIVSIHPKKLERGRIYIIAMVLAILANLSYLDICRGGIK
jgi:RNA polymerase sigma factor